MSTTLKALQQLEKERDQRIAQGPIKTIPPPQELLSLINEDPKQVFLFARNPLKWVAIALLAGVIAMLLFFFIPQDPATAPPAVDAGPSKLPSSGKVTGMNPSVKQPLGINGSQIARSVAPIPSDPVREPVDRIDSATQSVPAANPAYSAEVVKPWYGDEIKVQAIVYGPDSGARLAMINDRMVHQGDMVDGFVVVVIEENAVVVRQGRKMWKATLGR